MLKLKWFDIVYDPKSSDPYTTAFMVSTSMTDFARQRLCRVLKKDRMPDYEYEDEVADYVNLELRRRLKLPSDDTTVFVKGADYIGRPYLKIHRDHLKHLFMCMEICLDADIPVFTQGVLAGWWFEPSDLPTKQDDRASPRWTYEIAERAIVNCIMQKDEKHKLVYARLTYSLCKPCLMITEEGKQMARVLRRLGDYSPPDGEGSDEEVEKSRVAPRLDGVEVSDALENPTC